MKRIAGCTLVLLLSLANNAPAAAQTTVGGSAGIWRTNDHTWPRIAVNGDHTWRIVAARAEVWGVSRPFSVCEGGAASPCIKHHFMRGVSAGARLIYPGGTWRPFVGAGAGLEKYNESGGQLYAELGVRYKFDVRWGAELRGSAEWLAENSELHGGDSLNLGLWYALGSRRSSTTAETTDFFTRRRGGNG